MNRSTGMLMTGAVGSIFMTLAWVILFGSMAFVFSFVMGGDTPAEGTAGGLGGMVLLAVLLLLVGGVCQGIGFLGLKNLFGGVHLIAGMFDLLISLGIVLVVAAGFMSSAGMGQAGTYVMLFSIMLQAIFAGIGLLGGLSKASGGAGIMVVAGGAYLAAGLVLLLFIILGKAGINPGPSVGKVLGYVWLSGTIVGHALAAVVMLQQRKDDPKPTDAAA